VREKILVHKNDYKLWIALNIEKLASYSDENKKQDSNMIEALKKSIVENDASFVVVASNHGNSSIKLAESLKGVKVVSVSEFTYSDKVKKRMKKLKMIPLEKSDLPIQDNRKLRERILKHGSGVKAALEVAAIAIKNAIVEEMFIAVGGSKRLDTALLMKPAGVFEEMSVIDVISLP
jgi:hypothetical protein